MKKTLTLFSAAALAAFTLILTSCGHNAVVYSDGIGFDAGFDPEHFSASVRLRYGKILTVAVRDMVELEMTGEASGGQEQSTASASSASGLKVRIGRQVNGAVRDLIEAGATADQIRELLHGEAATQAD